MVSWKQWRNGCSIPFGGQQTHYSLSLSLSSLPELVIHVRTRNWSRRVTLVPLHNMWQPERQNFNRPKYENAFFIFWPFLFVFFFCVFLRLQTVPRLIAPGEDQVLLPVTRSFLLSPCDRGQTHSKGLKLKDLEAMNTNTNITSDLPKTETEIPVALSYHSLPGTNTE